MNNAALIIILIYLLINAFFTAYSTIKDRRKTADEHVAAHNTNNWLLVFLTMLGIGIAGGGTVSVVSDAFGRGLSAGWTNWGASISYLVFTLVSLKMFRVMAAKFGHNTGSGALQVLFGKKNSTLNSFIFIVFYLICFSLQPKATAAILCPLTNWNVDAVIWASGIFFVLITTFGGMTGVVWLSLINAIVLLMAMVVVCFSSVCKVGGLAALFAAAPGTYSSILQPSAGTVLGGLFTMIFANCFLSNSASVAFTAKSEKDAFIGFGITVVGLLAFGFLTGLTGIAAYVYDSTIPASNAMMSIAASVSPLMAGLAGCAVMAAIFSSAPGCLMAASNHITEDIFRALIKPQASDKERLLVSRIGCAVLGIAGIGLGYMSSSMIMIFYAAMQVVAPIGFVMLTALYWKRVDGRAAFWSVLFGTLVAFVWFILGNPYNINAFWPSFGVTAVLLIVLTLCAREPVSEGHKRYIAAKKEYEAEKAITHT